MDIDIAIDKYDIPVAGQFKGSVNATRVTINGEAYKHGTLQFLGFVGSRREDGKYAGVYRFSPVAGKPGDLPVRDFNDLPYLTHPPTGMAEAINDDGEVNDDGI